MAGLRHLRVTDRASGSVLAEIEVDPAAGERPRVALAAGRTIVLPIESSPRAGAAQGERHAVEVVIDGWRFELEVEDADRADLRVRATRGSDATTRGGPTEVRAIIPGRVLSVAVVPGDAVTTGGRLVSVEAMKMENEVRAPRDGVVERVAVGPGDTVDPGDLLVVIR